MTASFACPHCGHRLEVAVADAPRPKPTAQTPAPIVPASKAKGCGCGHGAEWHEQQGTGACRYGRSAVLGGCTCDKFHSRRRGSATPKSPANGHTPLSPCALAVLRAIVQRKANGTSRRQAAVIAGYSLTSGGYSAALGQLRAHGYIVGSSDEMTPTPEGIAAAGAVPPAPTPEQLIGWWADKVSPCAAALLERFATEYPRDVDRDRLASDTGYSPTSGGFSAALGELRGLGLVDGFRASDELMGGGS